MFASHPAPPMPFETDEVQLILTDDETGAQRRATAHLAVVDGAMYVRPRGGRRSAWARALAGTDAVAIAVDDASMPVAARPVDDDSVIQRVTEALLARFQYDPAMPRLLDDAAIAGTVQLVPTGGAATA